MTSLRTLLETRYLQYNRPGFIDNDPVSIPHRYIQKEDIEITGFLTALISWGQRVSIIRSGHRLSELFQHAPHDFILNHNENDLKACSTFVHRTFNGDDLISLIAFLKYLYTTLGGLEQAFAMHLSPRDQTVEKALIGFKRLYTQSPFSLKRTGKHIASPESGSACKRLNMYLRWMVRKDNAGVDFGIWHSIQPSQLVSPLDVHVLRQALHTGLLKTAKGDWKTAMALTKALRRFDKNDPVKYDFALFGMGVEGV